MVFSVFMVFARRLSIAAVIFFSFTASAAPLNELFEELRDSGMNYEVVGTICEQVARIELRQTYPETNYEIVTGIEYSDSNRTLGELDVVVFENSTKQAVLVAEVKCWKDLSAARQKALNQRERFIKSLSKKIELWSQENVYSKAQFKNVQQFVSIAPKGATEAGFEIDLDNTLAELMELRKLMINCQHQGECAVATRSR